MLQIISGEIAKHSNIKRRTTLDVLRLAKKVYESASSGHSHIVFQDRIAFIGFNDIFRILLEIKSENQIAKDILAKNLYHAEQISPGASKLLLCMLAGKDFEIKNVSKLNENNVVSLIKDIKIEILEEPLISAIKNSDFRSTISINNSASISYIKTSNEISLPISQTLEFGEKNEFSQCAIVAYDGVVEKISQIERVLHFYAECKIPVILFSRGFGYEVISTLLFNKKNGLLNVIPVTTNVNWESEFIIRDLSSCMQIESNEIGLTIKNYESFLVKDVKIFNSKLSISDVRIISNARKLVEKISVESYSMKDISHIVEKRKSFLSSSKIDVFIGNEYASSRPIVFDRLVYFSRMISQLKSHGFIEVKCDNNILYCCASSVKVCKMIHDSVLNSCESSYVVRNNVA